MSDARIKPLTEAERAAIYRLPFAERSLISMRNHIAADGSEPTAAPTVHPMIKPQQNQGKERVKHGRKFHSLPLPNGQA
jgi:hypothetical protein